MPYASITFAQARTELANRLGDALKIYWTDAELGLAIREGLRYWNCATLFWKNRFTFQSVSAQAWYDLTQQPTTVIPYTVKDTEVISFLLFNVIEPQLLPVTFGYIGTDMFTINGIVGAVRRRRDQFLLETGMVTSRSLITGPLPPQARVLIDESIIDVKRAAWVGVPGTTDPNAYGTRLYGKGLYGRGVFGTSSSYSTLWKTDEWAAESFRYGWANAPASPPSGFSTAVGPPNTLVITPPPQASGQVELITTNVGATLTSASLGTLLGIPDDFTWVVRMGALADLLGREGQSRDMQRAQYCEARWKEGIALAGQFTSVVTAYLNGVQCFPQSIHSLDSYRPNWQNESGPCDAVGMMSWNLLALAPPPRVTIFSIMLDMVSNAPVPVNDGDFLQIGREDLDALLDYCQHLCALKEGGDEFMATVPLYQSAVAQAKLRNSKIRQDVPFYSELSDRATKQEVEQNPKEVEAG